MDCNQNCTVSKCDRHCFSLKSLHRQKRPCLNATGIMCRGKQNKNKKSVDPCKNFEGAMFNRDHCYATPAFVLPSEKKDYLLSARQFLRDHENKVREHEQQPNELYVAKPRSKSLYCSVCHESYHQYVDHIKSSFHRNNARTCTFNDYILDLEAEFRSKHAKEHSISSTQITNRPSNDEQANISGITARKLVKVNSESAINTSPNTQLQLTKKTQNIPTHEFFFSQFQHSLEGFRVLENYNDFIHCFRPEYTWNSFYSQIQPMMGSNYSMFCSPFQQMMPINAQYYPFQQFW